MSIVYIKGSDWDVLLRKLQEFNKDVGKAQDTVVAKTAATARPKAFDIEEKYLEHGKAQTKYLRSGKRKTKSRWNAKGKYWETAHGRRLIQFSFENTAAKFRKGSKIGQFKPNAISRAYLTSLTANLWEKPTKPYKAQSPYFRREGMRKAFRWDPGRIRPGMNYFLTEVVGAVEGSIKEAVAKTEKDIFEGKGYE